jgi:hypothetical protein
MFSRSTLVVVNGKVYAVGYIDPNPVALTAAVSAMEAEARPNHSTDGTRKNLGDYDSNSRRYIVGVYGQTATPLTLTLGIYTFDSSRSSSVVTSTSKAQPATSSSFRLRASWQWLTRA